MLNFVNMNLLCHFRIQGPVWQRSSGSISCSHKTKKENRCLDEDFSMFWNWIPWNISRDIGSWNRDFRNKLFSFFWKGLGGTGISYHYERLKHIYILKKKGKQHNIISALLYLLFSSFDPKHRHHCPFLSYSPLRSFPIGIGPCRLMPLGFAGKTFEFKDAVDGRGMLDDCVKRQSLKKKFAS